MHTWFVRQIAERKCLRLEKAQNKTTCKQIAALLLTIVVTSGSAVARAELKTCSANRAYCNAEAKKKGWTRPQCADAFAGCMSSGEWHTSGPFGRTVSNVERR